MSIPVVFIHKGYSDYMEYALRQAKFSNQDSEIILLGDQANNKFDFVTHVDIAEYFDGAGRLAGVYRHYSTNPYHYELFCLQRWFILKEYMQQKDIQKCFVCDTDVMLYSDINDALKPFMTARLALLRHGKEYSLGISFISLKELQGLCDYIISCYQSDEILKEFELVYQNAVKIETVGGVSDMVLVRKWLQETGLDNVTSLMAIKNNSAFDSHIGLPHLEKDDQYKFSKRRKKINWQNAKPYCYSYKYKMDIKFHLLHFQGPAKYLMAKFYRGKNFAGKKALDLKFYFANIAAFWYKTLKIRYRFAWLFDIIFKLRKKRQKTV